MFEKIKVFFKRLFSNNAKKLDKPKEEMVEMPKEAEKVEIEQDFDENTDMYEYLENMIKTCDNYGIYEESVNKMKEHYGKNS